MTLDPRYIAGLELEDYFVDKDTGLPLAGGELYFYQDNSRTVYQNVYQLTGTFPNYSFIPLPNPLILSATGTPQDNNGNNITIYYLPFLIQNGIITDTVSLYYVAIYNSNGVLQFTRQAWPPNSEEGGGVTPGEENESFNYIPNGQFLIHNNLVATKNQAEPGSNIIAPGGWTFELSSGATSINTVIFEQIPTWTDNPPASPKFDLQIACTTPNPSDQNKSLRIRWDDVNKFANTEPFTFGFSGVANAGSFNVTVTLIKDFGESGSSFTPVPLQVVTLLNGERQFFTIPLPEGFGENAGYTIGTGETYVAIDIVFPTSIAFNANFNDFVLVAGSQTLDTFPDQTNADMVTRSVQGWTDIPDPNGFTLWLPSVQTLYGQTWDGSIVGNIESKTYQVLSPYVSDAFEPYLNADGTTYQTNTYSTLGIPLARLGNKYLNNTQQVNQYGIPQFGTGAAFMTAFTDDTPIDRFIIATNGHSVGITNIHDGSFATGFTFATDVSGSYFGITASLTQTNPVPSSTNPAIIVVAKDGETNFAFADGTGGNATGYDWTNLDPTTMLSYVNQTFPAIASLWGVSGYIASSYFTITTNTPTTNNQTRFWFSVNGVGTAPSNPGVLYEINFDNTFTGTNFKSILLQMALNGGQISRVICTAASSITAGSFFQVYTATEIYNVWYKIGNSGSAPTATGIPVMVQIQSNYTAAQVSTATVFAINAFCFGVPDFRGLYLRGADLGAGVDPDLTARFALSGFQYGAGFNTNPIGTLQYDQFRSHFHTDTNNTLNDSAPQSSTFPAAGDSFRASLLNTQNTGGNETRTINASVNWVIRY